MKRFRATTAILAGIVTSFASGCAADIEDSAQSQSNQIAQADDYRRLADSLRAAAKRALVAASVADALGPQVGVQVEQGFYPTLENRLRETLQDFNLGNKESTDQSLSAFWDAVTTALQQHLGNPAVATFDQVWSAVSSATHEHSFTRDGRILMDLQERPREVQQTIRELLRETEQLPSAQHRILAMSFLVIHQDLAALVLGTSSKMLSLDCRDAIAQAKRIQPYLIPEDDANLSGFGNTQKAYWYICADAQSRLWLDYNASHLQVQKWGEHFGRIHWMGDSNKARTGYRYSEVLEAFQRDGTRLVDRQTIAQPVRIVGRYPIQIETIASKHFFTISGFGATSSLSTTSTYDGLWRNASIVYPAQGYLTISSLIPSDSSLPRYNDKITFKAYQQETQFESGTDLVLSWLNPYTP